MKALTKKSTYKGHVFFYPCIFNPLWGQTTWLNSPQPTRSKARTIAVNYIKTNTQCT